MSGEGFDRKRNRQNQGQFKHMQDCYQCHRKMGNHEARAVVMDPVAGVYAICIACSELEPDTTIKLGTPAHPIDYRESEEDTWNRI